MMEILVNAARECSHNLGHFVGETTRRHYTLLGAPEVRRGHHFHGLGNLLRILDRLNSPAQIQQLRHERSLGIFYCVCELPATARQLVIGSCYAGAVALATAVVVAGTVDAWRSFHNVLKSASTCLRSAVMSSFRAFF